jgi:hypothetical protein
VLSGRLYVAAATVLVETPDKRPVRIPVVDRYFLAAFPRSTKIPTRITAFDEHGDVVARVER